MRSRHDLASSPRLGDRSVAPPRANGARRRSSRAARSAARLSRTRPLHRGGWRAMADDSTSPLPITRRPQVTFNLSTRWRQYAATILIPGWRCLRAGPRMWTAGCLIVGRRRRLRRIGRPLVSHTCARSPFSDRRASNFRTMEAHRRRHQPEDTSAGNKLQNRTWSHGNDSEEEEIASENTLLNEANEQRSVWCERAYRLSFISWGLLCVIV